MKFFISLCFILSFTIGQAQVTKIEHFFASSPKPEKLFQFFSKELELPVLWDYQSWGDFASGGVTLGNVAFELVTLRCRYNIFQWNCIRTPAPYGRI